MRPVLCAFTVWLAGASLAVAQPFAFSADGVASGGSPRGIVAADLDGDGHLDFAAANCRLGEHRVPSGIGGGAVSRQPARSGHRRFQP